MRPTLQERAPMIPYDLSQPSWTCRLPKALRELSGLALEPSGEFAWAINDEEGRLYRVHLVTGDVTRGPKFAKKGDYEGLAAWGDALIVARSDGRLYFVTDDTTRAFKSPLSDKSDVEGVAVDDTRSRLLVACKGPSAGLKDERHIYAVSLPDFEWSSRPAYIVHREALQSYLLCHPSPGVDPTQADDFAPSAIGIQPTTRDIYVLSSRAKMLLVLNASDGHPKWAAPLSRALFPQPEALDFDQEGALYVGSEARDKQALLHRFDPRHA